MSIIRKISIILISILVVLFVYFHIPLLAGEESDVKTLVDGNTKFAFDLYAKLKEKEGNLFFSPYSISTALAMTYVGARGNTEKQMAEVLHFILKDDSLHYAFAELQIQLNAVQEKGKIELSIANSIWGQEGYDFLKEFLDIINEYYQGKVKLVDFIEACENARNQINEWVEQKTKDKIKELIKPGILNPLTRLVLVNAIYFKGKWEKEFEKKLTKDTPFWLTPEDSVHCPMMQQKGSFNYCENDSLQILELPYLGNALSMIVLLPKKIDGLSELENYLNIDNLNKWMAFSNQEIKVYLPKFKMTSGFSLGKTLYDMGMPSAFSLPPADFSGMTGVKDLYISKVIHKAYVDVNEEGTEAAAATAVVMLKAVAVPKQPIVFRADHPFIFLIRDNHSGSVLFLGRLVDPTE
ncbi:MAG: serpin family protein [Candidatus Cloacimonetes bacterium]|nr:serpin family protein [Candidatus Cloacimonadota bacterium]